MGSLGVVRRLQTRPSYLICRLLFFVVTAFLFVLAVRFYSEVREVLSVCKFGNDWTCDLDGVLSDDGQEKEKPTETSISALPTPSDGKTSWVSGIGSSLGGLSGSTTLREWDYSRDANDTAMSDKQCQKSFPELYYEIARAQSRYSTTRISEKDVEGVDFTSGRVRASIQQGKLYVLRANLTSETRPKALAVLQSLNSAVLSAVPDIEFVFSVERHVPEVKSPIWVFDRLEGDEKVWLMPSPEFVWEGSNFTSASVGSNSLEEVAKGASGGNGKTPFKVIDGELGSLGTPRTQLVAQAEDIERVTNFSAKVRRLVGVWRTDGTSGSVRQRALVYMMKGKSWAEGEDGEDVKGKEAGLQGIDSSSSVSFGSSSTSSSPASLLSSTSPTTTTSSASIATGSVSLSEMCRFSFLAHDSSFNIPVADGPLLCRSVMITTKPKWIDLYHGLMLANDDNLHLGQAEHPVVTGWREKGAGKQNVVLVADDFGDLAFKMEGLLQYPEVAEKIAGNFVDTFRGRYLTNAATACYWRQMIQGYSKVSYKPAVRRTIDSRLDPGNGGVVERSTRSSIGLSWDSFRFLDSDSQMDFDVTEMR